MITIHGDIYSDNCYKVKLVLSRPGMERDVPDPIAVCPEHVAMDQYAP